MERSEKEMKNLSMFYPKTKKGILSDYPELKKIGVFEKINKNEMLFVWYFACQSSPFHDEEDPKIRCERSVIEAFGPERSKQVMGAYSAGNYSERVRLAISEMQKFQIGPRIRAKMMVEKIMSNYEQLIDIDTKTAFKDKDHEEDWTKKKAYIDSCAKISSTLPTLITQSEGGFGVTEKEDGQVISLDSSNLIDKFHDSND